jgi:hypothetical protein
MFKFIKITVISFAIFFSSWFVLFKLGINTLPLQSEDVLPSIFLPAAVINEGTLYLDSYYDLMLSKYPHPDDKDFTRGLTPFYIKKIEGADGTHYASAFPLITPLLSLVVYFIPLKLGLPVTFSNMTLLGHISSALIISVSGGVLYLLLKKHFSLKDRKALLLTGVYFFGTINLSLLSQGLWQHGTVELFSILALWFLFERKWFETGLMLGLTILSRPTAVILVPFLGLLIINYLARSKIDFKGGLLKIVNFVLGFVPSYLFFTWYTNKYYIDLSNNGYSGQLLNSWLSPFPEGFLGMWLSPSKGILVYSPVLLLSLVGLYLVFRKGNWRREENLKYIVFGAIVVSHTLVLSIWKHWYGGYGYGYRMASDVIPFMILLLVPYMKSVIYKKAKLLFWVLFTISIMVQIQGLIFFDSIWHAAYDRGFRNTSWLWSIRDSETAFNIRRILVKLGLLERACPQCLPL